MVFTELQCFLRKDRHRIDLESLIRTIRLFAHCIARADLHVRQKNALAGMLDLLAIVSADVAPLESRARTRLVSVVLNLGCICYDFISGTC